MNSVFQEAFKYWNRGWNVIPLCPGSKKPLISWSKYQTQCNTKEELIEWFLKNPQNNVGIVTGKISNLIVVDLDGAEGLQSGNSLSIQSGVECHTPHGKHLYYSWTEVTKNAVKILPGIDIRADGGYVVAPPSTLEGGSAYKWRSYSSILPDWSPSIVNGNTKLSSDNIIVGRRNDTLASIAGRWRREGLELDEIYDKLIRENNVRCQPPLPESEVRTIANSICRYEKGSKDLDSISIEELFRDNKEPKWIVDKLIPEESISIIGGVAGIGKSFMTLDLAIEATQGGLWLGKYQTQKCNVLYIDEESSGSLLKDRLTKMITAKGLSPSNVPIRISLNKGIKFSNMLKLKAVKRLIEQYKPKLIIVDSLIKVNSGDENFSTAIAQFFEPIAQMTHEYGISFIFIDHEGKSVYQADNQNKEPSANDLRGSNAKSAAVDAVFSLRTTKEGLRFYHTKSRFGEAVLPITIRISDEGTDRIFVRGY